MKGLAIETIIKWIIGLTLIIIVVNLVIFFSDEIKRLISKQISEKEWKTDIIEAKEFSTSQVATYIRACWDRTGERFHEDVICFILKGNVSNVDPNGLSGVLQAPAQVDVSNFDKNKNVTIIRFKDVGNVVIVES